MSDNPTEKLPRDKAPSTAPTIETVLERMNALHSETMAAIAELREEMKAEFRLLEDEVGKLKEKPS